MLNNLRLFLVCYDITNDKTRTHLAKDLLNFGDRIQKSVFECRVSEKRYQVLLSRLKRIELGDDDRITVYPLYKDAIDNIVYLGLPPLEQLEEILVI